jgi:hypothetical protein
MLDFTLSSIRSLRVRPVKKLDLPESIRYVVGLGRIELPTSRLSGVRSNHLSYRPCGLPHPNPLPRVGEGMGEGN